MFWVYIHNVFLYLYKMPNFDRTGPAGAGARTGRGMGTCAGDNNRRCGQRRGYGMRAQANGCPRELSLEEQEKNLKENLALVQAARQKIEKSE